MNPKTYPNVELARKPTLGNTESIQQGAKDVEKAYKLYIIIKLSL